MCGLFGNLKLKKSKLNKSLFNVLGVDNDTRGGDSCGINIDGVTEYGVNNLKLYENFYSTSTLLQESDVIQYALGHCRKASVGAISEATAQPVEICNERGEVEFVLIHNGTLTNYEKMAKKYIPEFDIKRLTDSQILANIIYQTGFEVLGEYTGAAALVMVDFRNCEKDHPKYYLFKGKSKKYTAGKSEDERPLFIIKDEDELWFSSKYEFLEAFMYEKMAETIPSNTLLLYEDNNLIIVDTYNRENIVAKTYNTVSSYGGYGGYGGYGHSTGGCSTYGSSYSGNNNRNNRNIPFLPLKNSSAYYIVMCDDLKFYLGNEPVNGITKVNKGGFTQSSVTGQSELPFMDGQLLKGFKAYDIINRLMTIFDIKDADTFNLLYPDILYYLSYFPILDDDTGDNKISVCFNGETYKNFNGELSPLFSQYSYSICNGDISYKYQKQLGDVENAIFMEYLNKQRAYDNCVNIKKEVKKLSKIIKRTIIK